MAKIFKPRRGLKSTMSTTKSNTVLAAGEMFFEIPNGGLNSGPGRIMLGDGVSAYSALTPFMEQTDVSSAQVTVTADNSSTSTAALNNVATGATTGAIVGSLKQAISLTKSELTNTIDDNITTLQTNFQAGVNSVYNAVVAKGVTPASTSLSDIITGIGNIATQQIIEIQIYRETTNIIQNSASTLTFHAENGYNASYPSTTYPAQWHIEGSNDLSTWTTLFNHNHTGHTNYNTDVSVNISGYKYLKFGEGTQGRNYMNIARFKNITFA